MKNENRPDDNKNLTDNLTINEWGWVSYEELWRSRRVLSVEAVGRGV